MQLSCLTAVHAVSSTVYKYVGLWEPPPLPRPGTDGNKSGREGSCLHRVIRPPVNMWEPGPWDHPGHCGAGVWPPPLQPGFLSDSIPEQGPAHPTCSGSERVGVRAPTSCASALARGSWGRPVLCSSVGTRPLPDRDHVPGSPRHFTRHSQGPRHSEAGPASSPLDRGED